MIKYQFLVYHKELEAFLEAVRDQGVVDITRSEREASESEKAMWNEVNRYGRAMEFLADTARTGQVASAGPAPDMPGGAADMLRSVEGLQQERESLQNKAGQLQKEIAAAEVWGHFDPQTLQALRTGGCQLQFFAAALKQFNPDWAERMALVETGRQNGKVYFVAVQPDADDAAGCETWQAMTAEAEPQPVPEVPAENLQQDLRQCEERLAAIQTELLQLTALRPALVQARDELLTQIDFGDAAQSADDAVENRLAVLEGYVPVDRDQAFRAFLDTQSAVYLASETERHENAPVLLKNNWFARLFEPICAMNSMPLYGEIDMTPFVAPFFWLFYGFCLADGGYGLLFIIAAGIAKRKMKPAMKPILTLVQFFGLSTLLFGILTGNFFGISLGNLAVFADVKDKFLDSDFLFTLSLIVGLVQILFGMCIKVVNIIRQQGWRHAISTISWLWLIVSSIACFLLSKYAGQPAFALGKTLHLAALGLAAVGIFLFNSPGRNPLVNVGAGLWDTYNMVTGMVGDLLSYIRLFVLGLSGSILGAVFNTLAFGLSPDIPVLGFLVSLFILLFGHGINIFMNGLGSFVHTIRLTFLEFYKASGYSGGGQLYNPFRIIHTEQ
ncbi:MAG: V-type ATP synthase subunit I [Bacteroidales bacterium]|nr:V-type ATP synthase subunit I [Bacteroidales bacterium]